MLSPSRTGNFTSSGIVALTTQGKVKGTFGKPAFTYIEKKNKERRLGRPITKDFDAKSTSWGNLIEQRAFDLLSTDYVMCSKVTLEHPIITYWKGTPDAYKEVDNLITIVDEKCPFTLDSFCDLVDAYKEEGKVIHKALTIEAVRANHKEGDTYYWQIISNACLIEAKTGLKVTKGELIIYVPYKSELEAIRDLASSAGEGGEYTKWINFASDEQLPHLIDGGRYKNINIIEFDIPNFDKEFLKSCVLKGGELLEEIPEGVRVV